MSKNKTHYTCSGCKYQVPKWVGCCPACQEWDSFVLQTALSVSQFPQTASAAALLTLDDIKLIDHQRMTTGIKEWDRVLGGGILPGSFLIVTGDPGIGKSTLLLQVAERLAQQHQVLYFSSEESLQQVKSRADRLGLKNSSVKFSDQAQLDVIINTVLEHKPHLVILDSIQNCYREADARTIPGTVGQLREAAHLLMRLAKENGIAVMITGHITKDGMMAGPKVLEHMVDGVFYLQAEDRWQTRILRSVKNRFGEVHEVGFFEMGAAGFTELTNINQQLLQQIAAVPGSMLICSLEGTRPLLCEVQALCINSRPGIAQRVVTGLDQKRVVLIAAILEKYLGVAFSAQDIFFKVSGGLWSKDSSTDLGIALALLSSYFQKPLPAKAVAMAELSLTGQIKAVNNIAACIKEVEKFGLEHLYCAQDQKLVTSCKKHAFRSVYELLTLFPVTP